MENSEYKDELIADAVLGNKKVELFKMTIGKPKFYLKGMIQNTIATLCLIENKAKEKYSWLDKWSDRDDFVDWLEYDWYYRYDTVIYDDENGNVKLKLMESSVEKPNSFIVVPKLDIRGLSGLLYADENFVESISHEMAIEFVHDFNAASDGKIYQMNFTIDYGNDNVDKYTSSLIYGDVTKGSVMIAFNGSLYKLKDDFYQMACKLIEKLNLRYSIE